MFRAEEIGSIVGNSIYSTNGRGEMCNKMNYLNLSRTVIRQLDTKLSFTSVFLRFVKLF